MLRIGCGTTAVATIMSAVYNDVDPLKTTREILEIGLTADPDNEYKTIEIYFENNGINAQTIIAQASDLPNKKEVKAKEIQQYIDQGDVIIARYINNNNFYGGETHFVSIVDTDNNGNFMVLNPGYTRDDKESGWFDGNAVESNMQFMVVIDGDDLLEKKLEMEEKQRDIEIKNVILSEVSDE